MKSSRYVLYAGAIAAVLVVALIASFQLRDSNPVATSASPSASTSAVPTPTAATASPSASVAASATARPNGAITGRVGYPSDFVPPLTVYAISVSDPSVWISTDTPRYGNPLSATPPPGGPTWPPTGPATYSITGLAPGTYHVIAYRNDSNPGVGIYSQHTVQCTQATQGGQNSTPAPGCAGNDHSLLQITVRAGETLSRIDITDWAFQESAYPSRPR